MDPLSDVLSRLRVRSYWSAGFDFGGDWALAIGPYQGIKFYAVLAGDCWIAIDGVPGPVHATAGDCVLLPSGRPFRVARDLAFTPVDPSVSLVGAKDGGMSVHNGGGHFLGIGGEFSLSGELSEELLGVLPPLVHVHREQDREELRWCIERMRRELREPQPGGILVAQQLATLLLVQALRVHLADGPQGVSWLSALADRQMAAALGAMHESPGAPWTVQSLAERAGMSRTSFALRFKETVGTAPLEYLTRWRMRVACDRLERSKEPISAIGQALGYESQSAFSLAFKRVMGCSPGQYGRGRSPSEREATASTSPG